GRSYEAVIRVNSQSGKGGMAYLLRSEHGLELPRRLQIEFSGIVQHRTDSDGGEVTPEALWEAFSDEYLPTPDVESRWGSYDFGGVHQESTGDGADRITVTLVVDGQEHEITGIGNGPLDAFVKALAERSIEVRILDYAEHALTEGDDSLAASYIECEIGDRIVWGVGIDGAITRASLEAITSALNRAPRARLRARPQRPAPSPGPGTGPGAPRGEGCRTPALLTPWRSAVRGLVAAGALRLLRGLRALGGPQLRLGEHRHLAGDRVVGRGG